MIGLFPSNKLEEIELILFLRSCVMQIFCTSSFYEFVILQSQISWIIQVVSYKSFKVRPALVNTETVCIIFAIKKSSERQSNALERLVRSAPRFFWLSSADFHFWSIDKRRCWALKPFVKLHWIFEKNGLILRHLLENKSLIYFWNIW